METPACATSPWARVWAWLFPARLLVPAARSDALAEVLLALGAEVVETDWQLAGGTERSIFRVIVGSRRARLICDSGEELVLIGDAALVAQVKRGLGR